MTALARDIKSAYPEHRVFASTPFNELWRYNPHAKPARGVAAAYPKVENIKVEYSAGIIAHRSETVHFLAWPHRDFKAKTGLDVPLTLPKPDLYFGPDEDEPLVKGRYWVIVTGGKADFVTKVWSAKRHQQVADALRSVGISLVQVGGQSNDKSGKSPAHHHPKIDGALDLIGKTTLRDLMRLIRDADGVICGVTCAMHMAAALDRPCVVIAGGREAWWWEAYVNENKGFGPVASGKVRTPHRFLHTAGLLDCDRVFNKVGCWKRFIASSVAHNRCRHVSVVDGQDLPACMDLIKVDHVVEAALSFYTDGSLPPIGAAKPLAESLAIMPPAEAAAVAPALVKPLGMPLVVKRSEPTLPDEPDAKQRSVFDDNTIGGKFTIFTLLYGDYFTMHEQHLLGLVSTIPQGRAEIRVGSNQLGNKSARLVEQLERDGTIAHHNASPDNRFKYPVMRAMFRDPERPIVTPYLIWLDDDTMFDRNPNWLELLAQAIIAGHRTGARLFGPHYHWTLKPGQREWIKAASWYRGKPFQDMAGKPAPNGRFIHFASGSFWALETALMRAQDIPDVRIGHNGGDVQIGCQSYQGGGRLQAFSNKKEIVNWSAFKRRGVTQPHPGLTG